MQCVEFSLFFGTLRMDLLCALQPHNDAHAGVYLIEFGLDIAHEPSQHCALTSQYAPHPLELACIHRYRRPATSTLTVLVRLCSL
ncbi:hypothetical protein BER92_16195 [Xanthomonas fragariae]|nr:hypothetical protein BER92_16195 [Xanthomonas fragariae]